MHEVRLVDMHCHLDRIANAREVQRDAVAHGIAIFDTTVTPTDFLEAQTLFEHAENVRVGVGLHPWWLADGRATRDDAKRVAELARKVSYIGEIGLDLSPRYASSHELQQEALGIILDSLATTLKQDSAHHYVISFHAVRAVGVILDMLEKRELLMHTQCSSIFHWFSGTSDELYRVRSTGSYISVNEHTLATKRGREYARIMPLDQLLLETDAPPGLDSPYSAETLEQSLMQTATTIASLRRMPLEDILQHTTTNALKLLTL